MQRSINYYTDYDFLESDGRFRVAEHEVFFSFNNDSGAAAFMDWWYECGKENFIEYCKKNLKKLDKLYG